MKRGSSFLVSLTLFEQLIISIILFLINAISIRHLDNYHLAIFTNTLGLVAFLQGLSKSFIAEKVIVQGGKIQIISLLQNFSLFSVLSLVIIAAYLFNNLSLGLTFIPICIAIPIIVHFHAFRTLYYAFSKGSIVMVAMFTLFVLLALIRFVEIDTDNIGLLLCIYTAIYFIITLPLLYKTYLFLTNSDGPLLYSNDVSGYNVQILLNSLLVYVYSGLIYILGAYINPNIIGEFRRTLFLLYPLNQFIAVFSLLYFPRLASGKLDRGGFMRLGLSLFLIIIPCCILILYKMSIYFLDYCSLEIVDFICLFTYSLILFIAFMLTSVLKVKNRLINMNKIILVNIVWFAPLFIASVSFGSVLYIFGSVILFQTVLCSNFLKLLR